MRKRTVKWIDAKKVYKGFARLTVSPELQQEFDDVFGIGGM